MRKLCFVLLTLMIPGWGFSQDVDSVAKGLIVGAKVGANLTYLWGQGTNLSVVKPVAGIHFGAYVRYDVMDKISVQPELLFATRGIKIHRYYDDETIGYYNPNPTLPGEGYNLETPYSAKTKVSIFYLDLPIMVNYQAMEKLNIQAGPVFSWNIWDSYPRTYTSDNIRVPGDKSFSEIKRLGVGAAIGATYNFNLMGYDLIGGARYTLGFTRINQTYRANDDLRPSMIQVFLAYDIKQLFNKKTTVSSIAPVVEPVKEVPVAEVKPLVKERGIFLLSESNEKLSGGSIEVKNTTDNTTETHSAANERFTFQMTEGKSYEIAASKEGYEPKVVPISASEFNGTSDINIVLTKKVVAVPLEMMEFNIKYDVNKANLSPEALPELDKLANFLTKNPQLKVEVGSHTDARGSAEANNILSQKRAEAVVNYLISKGIDKSRLVAKGYGESELKVKDAVSAEDHAQNRRTTIKTLE